MTFKIFRTTAIAAALALGATSTLAQTAAARRAAAAPAPAPAAASPAAAPLTHGPAIAGMCLFFDQRAVASSMAGQSAATRLQQLAAQAKAEIEPQQTAFQTDLAAFQKSRPTLTPDAATKQEAALQQRYSALERLANLRQQELQRTQQRALDRIHTEMDPIVRAVYQSQHCSVLFNGDASVFVANPGMDVSPQIIAQLNAKLPTITFDREHLDQPGAAPQR